MSAVAGTVAAVDCGTNSTRLLVASGDGMVLDRQMRITRLGEGVDATGVLSADAVARTVAVLRDYGAVMDNRGVVRARVVATSAAHATRRTPRSSWSRRATPPAWSPRS